jgi:hypothetical protein
VVESTLFLHPDDVTKRRAVLHLVEASALATCTRVDRHSVTILPGASTGQLRLWAVAASLAGEGGTLFAVRDTDAECRQAVVEALAIWCGIYGVPSQRSGGAA